MYKKRYKKPLQQSIVGPETGLVSPVSFLYFLAEFPSGAWRLAVSTYLPQLLRSTIEGAQGGAPPAIQEDAGGLM